MKIGSFRSQNYNEITNDLVSNLI